MRYAVSKIDMNTIEHLNLDLPLAYFTSSELKLDPDFPYPSRVSYTYQRCVAEIAFQGFVSRLSPLSFSKRDAPDKADKQKKPQSA